MVMVKISIISAGLTEMDERLDYTDKSQQSENMIVRFVWHVKKFVLKEQSLLNQPTKNGTKKQLEHML